MKVKKIASLQSFFLPWIGVFNQVYEADIFVIADNLQFEKKSWINRNRIKNINGGFTWLTVPIKKASLNTKINEIMIDNNQTWKKKHLKMIEFNYQKSPFFSQYFPKIQKIYNDDYEYLIDFNLALFFFILEELGFDKNKITYESKFELPNTKNEAIIKLCQDNCANVYFSGEAAKCYLDYEKFSKNGIDIELQHCKDIMYNQVGGDWVPKLSILDTLFMVGAKGCKKIITQVNIGDDKYE